jgi:hypothetical protein
MVWRKEAEMSEHVNLACTVCTEDFLVLLGVVERGARTGDAAA